ncbi:MAG: hypothetical protein IJX08_06810 [Clostridia bacterium]|nr:hypothetical protein [Clostridia bacterium]
MRLIKNYRFRTGTKIAFSELPQIVHQFMDEQGLTSTRFLYCFKDYGVEEGESKKSACEKILKDCPSLGEIHVCKSDSRMGYDTRWLSNVDTNESFPEERILPLMKKIHRHYGFASSLLRYFDMDFFNHRICLELDDSRERKRCEAKGIVFDPSMCEDIDVYGSGISLYRDVSGYATLTLSVDLLHNGEVLDPTSYYEAMNALLPKIKSEEFLTLRLTDEERVQIAKTNEQAMPMIEECRAFFKERFYDEKKQNFLPCNYSVANPLKKLAKRYGYSYRFVYQGIYSLEKRTARGAILQIGVEAGPSRYSLGARVSLHGVGFEHSLGVSGKAVQTQEEADALLEQIFKIVDEFEATLLPSLDALFPPTPDWFTIFV